MYRRSRGAESSLREYLRARRFLLGVALLGVLIVAMVGIDLAETDDLFVPEPNDPAIGYRTQPTTDPISKLNGEIAAGRVQLAFEDHAGYLGSVLKALNIPIESQMMVFSKTGVQAKLTDPQHPRTLFFNDSVVIGWVDGGFIEVASQDPRQGVVFYTLTQAPAATPQFIRRDGCLSCHYSNSAMGVSGMLVRSQFTSPTGTTMPWLGDYIPDDRSPMAERWGGWYVTGKAGAFHHMGNAFVTDASDPDHPVTDQSFNLASLAGRFDTDKYLSPYSDIVALLVFEHQMHMMNLMTRIGWQTRYLLQSGGVSDSKMKGLRDSAEELVDYMLFVDETPLPNRVEGTSGFMERFSAEGPKDHRGRSLRQLDLHHRLMKYPCSYLIYSDEFDALPPEARDAVYQRLWLILSGRASGEKYSRLSRADRRAIVEILRDTKKQLPDYFR